MRILLDTNMLLDAIKFRVDIGSEAKKFGEPFTLSSCVSELERISTGNGREALQAELSLKLTKELPFAKTEGLTDRAILKFAANNECIVATNDKKLIKALKLKGIRVVRLRQKRYLVEA